MKYAVNQKIVVFQKKFKKKKKKDSWKRQLVGKAKRKYESVKSMKFREKSSARKRKNKGIKRKVVLRRKRKKKKRWKIKEKATDVRGNNGKQCESLKFKEHWEIKVSGRSNQKSDL